MHEVSLVINGNRFTGWEDVSIRKSMDALCGQFNVRVSYKDPFPIEPSVPVQVYVDSEKVMDGYIDSVRDTISANQSQLQIVGRDKAQDIIDASAVHSSQEFKDISFESLLNKIASPFGISVDIRPSGLEKFKKFSLQQEAAIEAIERACRLRGVFVNSDNDGNIIVENYGVNRADTSLVLGQNIEAYMKTSDFSDRFSEYIVRGQQQGDDSVNGIAAAEPEGRAQDPAVTRYRPLIIVAEGNVSSAIANKRAKWEASVRQARSEETMITVTGWRERQGGNLWSVNTLVPVSIESRGINQDMLITEVSYNLSDSTGFTTDLLLSHKDAYQLEPSSD